MLFPWPDHKLSTNARYDRRSLTANRRRARLEGKIIAMEAGLSLPAGKPLVLTLRFHAPDERHDRADLDGLLSAMKPSIDGIFDWLELDDHAIERIDLERGSRMPEGRVMVRLEVMQ